MDTLLIRQYCVSKKCRFLPRPMSRFCGDTQANQGVRMDKERYQTQSAENITPLVASNNRYTQEDRV